MITGGKIPDSTAGAAALPAVEWTHPKRAKAPPVQKPTTDKPVVENEAKQKNLIDKAENLQLSDQVKRYLGAVGRKLSFSLHEPTGQMIVRIINRETDEVIREIPMEEFLEIEAQIKESIKNFLDVLA